MISLPEIIAFVTSLETWFECEEVAPDTLNWVSREHGCEESPGEADLREAYRIKSALKMKFGTAIVAIVEPCDEWVNVEVRLRLA